VRPFAYACPKDVAGALAAVGASGEAKFLGGGTNLVDLMRLGVETPAALIDVTRLPLGAIEELPGDGLRIGAVVRNSDLASDRRARARYPVLAQARRRLGAAPERGDDGRQPSAADALPVLPGRDEAVQQAAPGQRLPGSEGEHRNLAVLGYSAHCVATHPSDMAVALAALDAVVHVSGRGGERAVPLVDFHRLPGDRPELDAVLQRDELVVAVELPPLPLARRSRYRKVRERASFSFALVSVAAAVELEDGAVRDARVAFGGLAHKPWRAYAAEDALRGSAPGEAAFRAAADAELGRAAPLRENAYKVPMARNALVSTLLELSA